MQLCLSAWRVRTSRRSKRAVQRGMGQRDGGSVMRSNRKLTVSSCSASVMGSLCGRPVHEQRVVAVAAEGAGAVADALRVVASVVVAEGGAGEAGVRVARAVAVAARAR